MLSPSTTWVWRPHSSRSIDWPNETMAININHSTLQCQCIEQFSECVPGGRVMCNIIVIYVIKYNDRMMINTFLLSSVLSTQE